MARIHWIPTEQGGKDRFPLTEYSTAAHFSSDVDGQDWSVVLKDISHHENYESVCSLSFLFQDQVPKNLVYVGSKFELFESRKVADGEIIRISLNYYQLGEEAYASNKFTDALSYFEKENAIQPSGDCLNYIACCHLALGNYEKAITIFNEIHRIKPDWERPVFNLGRVYLKLGEREKALDYLYDALELNPENEDTYFYLGVFFLQNEDFTQAKDYFLKSLTLDEEQSETHLNLGICYYRLKQLESALHHFDRSYSLDHQNYDAISNKGLVLLRMKNYSEAISILKIANQMDPQNIQCINDIIYCYINLKNYNEAYLWAETGLKVDSENERTKTLYERIREFIIISDN